MNACEITAGTEKTPVGLSFEWRHSTLRPLACTHTTSEPVDANFTQVTALSQGVGFDIPAVLQ
jgi:hypothetical protein